VVIGQNKTKIQIKDRNLILNPRYKTISDEVRNMKGNTSDEDKVHLHRYKVEKNEQNKREQEGKIEISPQAKDNQNANQIIAKRDERIKQLKKQIDEGTYKVQPMKVAEKMLSYFNKK
jgi:negative regulator of flagellin synthesis FlgM